MGYLDGSTVIVDAVLTKLGRKKLAEGGALNISKFALGDTGVDYTLWNVDHPSGSNSYGKAITQLPQLEAVTSETNSLRFKLATFARDTEFLPHLTFPGIEANVVVIKGQGSGFGVSITPKTQNATDQSYMYEISDTTAINFALAGQTSIVEGSGPTGFEGVTVPSALEIPRPVTLVGTGVLTIEAKQLANQETFNIQVTGMDTGATDNILVTAQQNDNIDGAGVTEG